MVSKLPESTRSTYARQLADEAKTLVPGVERLGEIVAELRADDLYQTLGFDTWERFCADYIGVTKRTANRWIGTWKQAAIPARSTEHPKSIGAGQSVAAGQNVPVVESDTLKSPAASAEVPAKTPEGEGERATSAPSKTGIDVPVSAPLPSGKSSADGEPRWRPAPDGSGEGGSTPPVATGTRLPSADPSSGGARATAPPPQRETPTEVPPASRPAPPGPSERPPTDRALTARVFAAMREIDPTDAGPVTTPEEATFLRQWAQRTLDAWKAKNVPTNGAAKPQRRQGTISRPADRAPKPPAKVNGAPLAGSLTRRTVEPMFKK